jgi:hypothetical protein
VNRAAITLNNVGMEGGADDEAVDALADLPAEMVNR